MIFTNSLLPFHSYSPPLPPLPLPLLMEDVSLHLLHCRPALRAGHATIPAISAPIASDAVAAGLGALSTCSALGRAINWKSCTISPSGVITCERTPLPPVARSSGRISGTRRCSDWQKISRLNERRSSYHAIEGERLRKRHRPLYVRASNRSAALKSV